MVDNLYEQGIFLNFDKSVVGFQQLLEQHTYLIPMIEDHKNSWIFQKQLIINIYHYLVTDDESLIYDYDKTIDRPLIFLIISFISMSEDIRLLKIIHNRNELLMVLISIFFSKKMTKFIHGVLHEADVTYVEENILDLIHLTIIKNEAYGHMLIKEIQRSIVVELKGDDYTYKKFSPFIKEAIKNAKRLNNLMQEGVGFIV